MLQLKILQLLTLLATTIFTLIATSTASSCSNTDAVTITVSGGGLTSVPTATPGTICAGETVQLDAVAGGGSGTYTYIWTSLPAGFSSTAANPTATPAVNTTYLVAVNDGFSTVNSQVTVTVNALPTVNAGVDATIPGGTSTTLNATVTGTGPFTYSWTPAAQLVNASIEDPTTVNLVNYNSLYINSHFNSFIMFQYRCSNNNCKRWWINFSSNSYSRYHMCR